MRRQYAFKREDLPQNTIVFDLIQDEESFVYQGYGFPPLVREEYMTETVKNQIHEKLHVKDQINITKNPPINDDLFARELEYQVCLAITEGLLRLGLVTNGEAHKAEDLLLKQYRPPIGTLLAEAG